MAEVTARRRNTLIWAWIAVSIVLLALLSYNMFEFEDKSLFMPGPLTDGHHQIGVACSACHTDPLADGELIQKACVNCHGDDRKKPFDSHPRSKFTDPRNADTLENIDALMCVTCHSEHQPDMTAANGLTQPTDFCVHCHQDIGKDRPSHEGMAFDSCNAAGCHNFHNNRSLYTDFLLKHLDEADVLEHRTLPAREFADLLAELMDYPADRYPIEPLTGSDADAPADIHLEPAAHSDWLETAHAKSGVNCTACHTVVSDDGEQPLWTDKPDHRGCAQCHNLEVERFKRGKHGMRLAVDLPPMTVAEARLPMQEDAAHRRLTCTSCHGAHRFDVREAAVNACLDCHADTHSLAYQQSPHFDLWQKEISGTAEAGSGVSCASCHMPRVNFDVNDWMSRTMVEHNQNATLSPNEKMIRPACLHCHGLGFSLDAMADRALIENNFHGSPAVRVKSMELAEADQQRAMKEKSALQED
jgi:predicted CXXCH cytochrome family protein